MIRRGSALAAVTLVSVMAAPIAGLAQGTEAPPRPFLRKVIQLGDAELATIDKGEVVTRPLASPEKAEIAAFGAVKVSGTLTTLRERMRDFPSFRKVPQIVQVGVFSNPPRLEDLAGLTMEDADLDALEDCKPGDCSVKISTVGLDRLKKEVNWSGSGAEAKARATAIIKEQMLAYVKAYMAGGTGAMGVTVDKSQPKALSAEFKTLLRNSPYLPEYVPAFNQYLETYPQGSLPGSISTIFWAKDTFGLKPVVSIYHATTYLQEQPRPGLLAAIKTIYASHYFNAALEMMVAVPADASSFYLLDLYRTRIDPPTGMLSGVLLGKVKSGVEQGVAMNLKNAKSRVEGK
jgi:hypothetical protein